MDKTKKLLVIANLSHSSPRIPNLLTPLAQEGWDIKVVTPCISKAEEEALGFPKGFKSNVDLVYTPNYQDVYQPIRNVLRWVGLVSGEMQTGFTSALKSTQSQKVLTPKLIDRLLVIYQSFLAFPDTEKAWRPIAQKIVEKCLKANSNCIILSSSPYPVTHIIANRASKKFGVRWIADFRDPWSDNHNYKLPEWRRHIDKFMEVRTLKQASILTTVSSSIAKKMNLIHAKEVRVIANGFQPNTEVNADSSFVDRLEILYTGAIYPEYQNVEVILDALKIIHDEGLDNLNSYRLKFFGHFSYELQEKIVSRGLEHCVKQCGYMPKSAVRLEQSRAALLLVLQWEKYGENDILPLKFLEYLSAKRPILATGGSRKNEIAKVIRKTKAGVAIQKPQDVASYLVETRALNIRRGAIKFEGIEKEISRYSYEARFHEFAQVCNELI